MEERCQTTFVLSKWLDCWVEKSPMSVDMGFGASAAPIPRTTRDWGFASERIRNIHNSQGQSLALAFRWNSSKSSKPSLLGSRYDRRLPLSLKVDFTDETNSQAVCGIYFVT